MAGKRSRTGRALIWLFVIGVAIAGLNWAQVAFGNGSWTPQLALDLEGGTQIVLAPQVEEGTQVTSEQLDQAVGIIRQRIDSSGVSEAEITTQGSQNIVVSIPGEPTAQQLERIQSSAKMEFRPVLTVAAAATPEEIAAAQAAIDADPTTAAAPATPPTVADASDPAWITPDVQARFDTFDCAAPPSTEVAPTDQPLVTCSTDGTARYVLGPVEVEGADISDATFGAETSGQGVATGGWAINLEFNGQGTSDFEAVTSRITTLDEPRNQFAIVLDGSVLLAPASNAVISNGEASITGSFTQDEASSLADQLKFGALPIGFVVQSTDTISSTLGSSQLQSGLLAGLIGLILVVLYSLFQYRALAFVTVLSLSIAAALTYLTITYLSSTEGYRLSLAGVAGMIVAIGITADSFIVYFERVRDELRDGRNLVSSVEAGWKRALRTIIASDTVNFLAAVVLFFLAVGNVRGFAYTLGITTIIDLVVVMLFTHPMLQLLARTRFFGDGHRLSGLDPNALGAVYRGRARFREPVLTGRSSKSAGEAARRQSIAERKAEAASGTSTKEQ